MAEMQKLCFFIGWKPVAFEFPRSAESDSRDGQISFHEHMGMYVLLTIPGDTFTKCSVLSYQKVGNVNLLWGSEILGY